ncbi:metal-sulfur cluster assembly factor [Nonomuraea sp. JJY05]|jgi:metal-sulfur cluster biosynthetic enzyme|uniref:metal-sulfur cluster assembly factor n=1 Tax=Nonomuraea sp. JJY05 TaxID=3350255 RepID=UPI00373E07E7
MSEIPQWASQALSEVYDPCCRERGISVVEMGLVRSVEVDGGRARVELLLTSGWCPFAARVITEVRDRIQEQPGVREAEVEVVWDEAWTVERLSPRAARLLRFLPAPAQVPDKGAIEQEIRSSGSRPTVEPG